MRVEETGLHGARLIEAPRFTDQRGWFGELWNEQRYHGVGIAVRLLQDNVSYSMAGVLRGLHYQFPHAQAKLVSVLRGRVFDVIVDVRRGSPTFGNWFGHELSADNRLQLFHPAGMAHGFLVLSDDALVHYGCSEVYHADCDRSIAWNDRDIGIRWPHTPTLISAKDRSAPTLRDVAPNDLPAYEKEPGK